MINDILAIVEHPRKAEPVIKAAIALAEARGAHLKIAVLTPGPVTSPALVPLGAVYLPEPMLEEESRANVAAVETLAADARCPVAVFGLFDDVAWLAGDIRRNRQLADLIMVGPPSTWTLGWLRRHVLETQILSSGTPIFILPPDSQSIQLRRAVIGWKPSAEAARAVHDLVHMLEPGAHIDIVTIALKDEGNRDQAGIDVQRHLVRHGFAAEIHRLEESALRESEALQNFALERRADLLAVGGFAHSRVREVVLGGVTRELVEAPRIPILFSH